MLDLKQSRDTTGRRSHARNNNHYGRTRRTHNVPVQEHDDGDALWEVGTTDDRTFACWAQHLCEVDVDAPPHPGHL